MIGNLIDRIFVVVGAFIFLQAPQFFSLYTQRLGGHVAELQLQIRAMEHIAEKSGKTLPQLVNKFQSHGDSDFSLQGDMMHGMIARYQGLVGSFQAMQEATPFSKPFIFFGNFYADIAKSTLANFQFGVPISLEGVVYAFMGLIFGLLLFRALVLIKKGALSAPNS